jgi:hypothetical protein
MQFIHSRPINEFSEVFTSGGGANRETLGEID